MLPNGKRLHMRAEKETLGGEIDMSESISRRAFTAVSAGIVLGGASGKVVGGTETKVEPAKIPEPIEAPFVRDYPLPGFKPAWKKQQINRKMVQDFVIYAHFDPSLTQKLLAKEPALLNATMDWGAGDWETGLGGASHMGRRDIVSFLLEKGARVDIFCAAMMGQLEVVRGLLALQPRLIDAKGPHGFSLHFHAQVGGKESEPVLAYLQSIKHVELGPNPFLPKPENKPGK
jgi:hypothetical protein